MSVGSGFFIMILLPPVPERVRRFFTKEEKEIAVRRSKQAFNTPNTGVKLKQLRAVLTDRKVWFYGEKWIPIICTCSLTRQVSFTA